MGDTKTVYRKPGPFMVGREHKELYRLEELRSEAFREAGEEWGRITGHKDYYREILPQALFDLLDSYDREAGRLACEAWLQHEHGAAVTYPEKDPNVG